MKAKVRKANERNGRKSYILLEHAENGAATNASRIQGGSEVRQPLTTMSKIKGIHVSVIHPMPSVMAMLKPGISMMKRKLL